MLMKFLLVVMQRILNNHPFFCGLSKIFHGPPFDDCCFRVLNYNFKQKLKKTLKVNRFQITKIIGVPAKKI